MNVGSRSNKNTNYRVALIGHKFKPRTAYNSSNGTGESTNWRLDWCRLNNMSYAQALKTAVKKGCKHC